MKKILISLALILSIGSIKAWSFKIINNKNDDITVAKVTSNKKGNNRFVGIYKSIKQGESKTFNGVRHLFGFQFYDNGSAQLHKLSDEEKSAGELNLS